MKQKNINLTKQEFEIEIIRLCEERKITYDDYLFKKIFIVPNDELIEIVKLDFETKNPEFIISFSGKEEIIDFIKDTGIPYEILPYDNWESWENIIINYMKK